MKRLIVFLSLYLFSSLSNLYASKEGPLEANKFKEIARKLYAAQNLVPSEKYEFSSNISLGVYFLRYLGDLGEFSLDSEEISKMIKAIENLYDEGVNQTLKSLLLDIKEIRFYKEKSNYVSVIYTKNEKSIVVDINSKRDGFVQSINNFKIKNKSKIVLKDIETSKDKRKVLRKVTQKQRPFHAPNVNLVEAYYVESLKQHFRNEVDLLPLMGEVSGMEFNVSLKKWIPSIFRTIDLRVDKVGSNIGIESSNGELLPPFWLTAKKWWVHVISLIDS